MSEEILFEKLGIKNNLIVFPEQKDRSFGFLDDDMKKLLAVISKKYYPVFEFGTFKGHTTEILALNCPDMVYTIDIGHENTNPLVEAEKKYDYITGEAFKNKKYENIIQLIGDTYDFDFSKFYNKMGLIFIDGGHSHKVSYKDSINALKMIKDGGVIIWDDVKWKTVKETILELQLKYNIIINGRFAYYIKGDSN